MSPSRKAASAASPLWEVVDARLRTEVQARRPSKALRERAARVEEILRREFPDADCALHYRNAFELLVATILSAQCTDERVNKVTPSLFEQFPTPRHFVEAPEGAIEKAIHSTGFFNNKAKAIREASRHLLERFGGEMPVAMEDLLTLRGVARKTANVLRMHAFRLPGMAVDTHFSRITQRLGLTQAEDPEKIEFDVAALLPPEQWTHFADAVILHGRRTCHARKPACGECPLASLCPSAEQESAPEPAKPAARKVAAPRARKPKA